MKFYAVAKGRTPGIYNTWNECSLQVIGFSGAKYKLFPSLIEATNYIEQNSNIDTSEIIESLRIQPPIQYNISSEITFDPTRTIYVDGGFNKVSKPNAYGCVVNNNGQDLLLNNHHLLQDMTIRNVTLPVGQRDVIVVYFEGVYQQNNGAELLAMVAGLRIAIAYIKYGIQVLHLASDSKLLVESWSKCIKKESADKMPPEKLAYIHEVIQLRKEFESLGGAIIKISGAANPSDLGFH